MKILFVHDGPIFYDEEGNYYEYSFHGLYERYSYIADEVTFLMRTIPISKSTNNTLVPKEVQVIGVPNFKSPKIYFKEKPKAEKIIKEAVKKTDYLVLRDSACAQIALKYAKKYNIPYIYECVGCTWDSLWNYSWLGKAMAPFSFLITKRIIKTSPYVYYVTNEFLQHRYPTKGKSVACSNVVINPVEDIVLEKRLKRIRERIKKSKVILGTAAALDVRYKGQEHVIKAIPHLVKSGYEIEYRLAGGNRTNSSYLLDLAKECEVEDRVVFCGSLDSNQMADFYDSLDIYIQPSKQEGLPRSVIEAMSRGCPTAGTRVAGIPELLQEECLFKKGSDMAIVRVISSMLEGELEKIAEENFYKAKEYEQQILTERRNYFYDMFLKENAR